MFIRHQHILFVLWYLLIANTTVAFTHADSLRGGNGRGRNWWNVLKYELTINFDTANKSISGTNLVYLEKTEDRDSMQIDLQEPMQIDSIICRGHKVNFVREGNVYWLLTPFVERNPAVKGKFASMEAIMIYFHGSPREAVQPPWDGGIIWGKDSMGNAWYSVACQGLGASAWWPCKDQQSDEPDNGMSIILNVPKGLTAVSNGRLLMEPGKNGSNNTSWVWAVQNPINTYNVSFYIGDYVHWQDTFTDVKGVLSLDFYALRHNEQKARKQFAEAKNMLQCFTYWMGPYPFHEDGYKLVEAPFLGMEHQSAIAYGNEYKMGYLGRDRSNTGHGLAFDFIIIHESGHEWFGNNITARDIADNWIHEGFTTYTETLYTEWISGKEKAYEYLRGQRLNIRNDKPVIGPYGVHQHGSGDMYDKGATIVHMIRVSMSDDLVFAKLLHDLNEKFYHGFADSKEVEDFIVETYDGNIKHSSYRFDLRPFFEQYLRTTMVPELEYYIKGKELFFKFNNVVPGFSIPIDVRYGGRSEIIRPTAKWQSVKWKNGYNIELSKDFYYSVKS